MFDGIKTWLDGKKAILTSIGGMITAAVSWSQNLISTQDFVQALFAGAVVIFLRLGITKSGPSA